MSSLDSSSTLHFVRARYKNIATTAAPAACGCGVRREEVGIRCGARVDSAELRGMCLFYSSCFLSLHNMSSYYTNEERRTNTMSGATGFQKQSHRRSSARSTNRSSTQPQHDTTAASHASPTSFVCHNQSDLCVVFVCTQSTPQCPCMICIGWGLNLCCSVLVC